MGKPYVGRFAPSPSGQLHLGSLMAALASYLEARKAQGTWLLRIEDVDPLREVKGAKDTILSTLELFGFDWDSEILFQRDRTFAYDAVVQSLLANGLAYACTCSRKQLHPHTVYPGYCRDVLNPETNAAIRIRVPELLYSVHDKVQGVLSQHLGGEVGDFVIKRKEGFYAYQLAVVVDDAFQGVTDVVRGADLLDSTPRQLYLQELLGFPTLQYLHIPLLITKGGKKLSKSMGSEPLSHGDASALLIKALTLLGQHGAEYLIKERPKTILSWAITHWQAALIPRQTLLMV